MESTADGTILREKAILRWLGEIKADLKGVCAEIRTHKVEKKIELVILLTSKNQIPQKNRFQL